MADSLLAREGVGGARADRFVRYLPIIVFIVGLAFLIFGQLLLGMTIWLLGSILAAVMIRSRLKRMAERIVRERLCLACGYALIAQTLEERGRGRCPECGREFSIDEYTPPHTTMSELSSSD